MSDIPSGWNTEGVHPALYIYDEDDTLQYTWESENVVASETKDFSLFDYKLHLGIGTDFGSLGFSIHDDSNALTDLTDPRRPSSIDGEWRVDFKLGKDASGLKKVYQGKIRLADIRRLPQQQKITITSVGWGTVLSDWYLDMKYTQAKESDGLTPDDTDTSARVSALASSIFADVENYAYPDLGTPGFTTTGIDTIDVKLPDFVKPYIPISSAVNELANSGGALWGIDYNDNDVFMRYRGVIILGITVYKQTIRGSMPELGRKQVRLHSVTAEKHNRRYS